MAPPTQTTTANLAPTLTSKNLPYTYSNIGKEPLKLHAFAMKAHTRCVTWLIQIPSRFSSVALWPVYLTFSRLSPSPMLTCPEPFPFRKPFLVLFCTHFLRCL